MYPGQMGGNLIMEKQDLLEIDKEKEKQARENHCEIERRRRVKMAAYFNELCSMVPTCNTLQRKPDKLTILRMASSHMRQLRSGAINNNNNTNQYYNQQQQLVQQQQQQDSSYKPSFLTDQELKHLILEAADGFLFVVQCDTGNILYVSDAIQQILCYSPTEWYHRTLYDYVHIDDLNKVKEQLSSSQSLDSSNRILDLKTGTVKKDTSSSLNSSNGNTLNRIGYRRSFICRIRLGQSSNLLDNNYLNRLNRRLLSNSNNDTQHSIVHISGYTKSWSTSQLIEHQHASNSLDDPLNSTSSQQYCLIAIARLQQTSILNGNELINNQNEFTTRHDINGLITFVDSKVQNLLGYDTQSMLKKSLSDFLLQQDQQLIKEQFKLIIDSKLSNPPLTFNTHFKLPNSQTNDFIKFKTQAYGLFNPYNDEFEFIVCTHCLINDTKDSNNTVPLTAAVTTTTTTPYTYTDNHYNYYNHDYQTTSVPPAQPVPSSSSASTTASHSYSTNLTNNYNTHDWSSTNWQQNNQTTQQLSPNNHTNSILIPQQSTQQQTTNANFYTNQSSYMSM